MGLLFCRNDGRTDKSKLEQKSNKVYKIGRDVENNELKYGSKAPGFGVLVFWCLCVLVFVCLGIKKVSGIRFTRGSTKFKQKNKPKEEQKS